MADRPPPRIAAAMIVRDAQDTVVAAVESLRSVVDEVLVLDTGSADATVARLGALADRWTVDPQAPALRVEHWPWRDDFSAARNEAAARTGSSVEWIVVLDADEVLEPADLRATLDRLPDDFDGAVAYIVCQGADSSKPPDRFVQHRAYRKARGQYRYPVHNQLIGMRKSARTEAVVRSSYRDGLDRRMARSVPLLEKLYADDPTDIHAPLFLARMHAAVGDHASALRWSEIACGLCDEDDPQPGEVSAWVSRIHSTGAVRGSRASSAVLAEALGRYGPSPDIWHCALSLTAQEWIRRLADARGTAWEIGTDWPIVGESDIGRLQAAFDGLGLGLQLRATATEAGEAGGARGAGEPEPSPAPP